MCLQVTDSSTGTEVKDATQVMQLRGSQNEGRVFHRQMQNSKHLSHLYRMVK